MKHSLKYVAIKWVPHIKIRIPIGLSSELKILYLPKNLLIFQNSKKISYKIIYRRNDTYQRKEGLKIITLNVLLLSVS